MCQVNHRDVQEEGPNRTSAFGDAFFKRFYDLFLNRKVDIIYMLRVSECKLGP